MLETARKIGKLCHEEIPLWLGLALGGLYLIAVVSAGAVALHVQNSDMDQQRSSLIEEWVALFSRSLGTFESSNTNRLTHEVRQISSDLGVSFCAIVAPDGKMIGHSDPSRIGQQAGTLRNVMTGAGQVRRGTLDSRPGLQIFAAHLPQSSGSQASHELWVGIEPIRRQWSESRIALFVSYILMGVLGLYLIMYRLLRKSVQPLAVIRDRLLVCKGTLDDRLTALRLSDSYDQTSSAWNRMIEFMSEMQEQLRQAKLNSNVNLAMDGYRSEQLTELLMHIPFGVMAVDSGRTITFANRAASGMLGPPGETLEGRPLSAVLGEDLQLSLLSSGKSKQKMPWSSSRWLDHTFESGENPTTLRFWAQSSDVGHDEYIVFVQDISQAKESERARDRFLYHVTHEFRTPLTNIRAYAETLSQGIVQDEKTIRECYNVIMGETSRLSRLVEDLLSVSQFEVGSVKLNKREVNMAELLRKVVQDNQGSADAGNIDLTLRLPAKIPPVPGDRDRLAVVFSNLIGNAIKYTPKGGRIEIRCAVEHQQIEVAVSDNGIGIEPKDQEKIFEKFYRVNDERVAKVPGTGLGLAIARETVRAHGGSIVLTSTVGQGSTFTTILPALVTDSTEGPAVPAKAI